ncbi:sodium/bile acid cotransporter 7 [Nematolebias whitei]|uniref:sodium/bile acid cotransporter 7 n=1 Tax=Nematolebias whitei TaxID=451745 RepID=UPI00189B2381|nr:sodium/bile acid cotransporter 7 [Nematolebias whitei]
MGLVARLRKEWFIIGIVVVILSAKLQPSVGVRGGPLKPEITIAYVAVSLIFFNSGLSLKTEELTSALLHVRLHLFVQSFTLIFFPFAVWLLLQVLALTAIDPWLLRGVLLMFDSEGNMDEMLGFLETSADICRGSRLHDKLSDVCLYLGNVYYSMNQHLKACEFFLQSCKEASEAGDVALLQKAQVKTNPWKERPSSDSDWSVRVQETTTQPDRKKPPFGAISSAVLLMIIYTTFCDTFSNPNIELDPTSLLLVVIISQ